MNFVLGGCVRPKESDTHSTIRAVLDMGLNTNAKAQDSGCAAFGHADGEVVLRSFIGAGFEWKPGR